MRRCVSSEPAHSLLLPPPPPPLLPQLLALSLRPLAANLPSRSGDVSQLVHGGRLGPRRRRGCW